MLSLKKFFIFILLSSLGNTHHVKSVAHSTPTIVPIPTPPATPSLMKIKNRHRVIFSKIANSILSPNPDIAAKPKGVKWTIASNKRRPLKPLKEPYGIKETVSAKDIVSKLKTPLPQQPTERTRKIFTRYGHETATVVMCSGQYR